MRALLSVLLPVVAVCLSTAAVAAQQRINIDGLIAQFEAIAFDSQETEQKGIFLRWDPEDPPVRIYISGANRQIASAVIPAIERLRQLTRLDIEFVETVESSNLRIEIGMNRCEGRGDVGVSMQLWVNSIGCLYSTLANALGPANFSCAVQPSVFCKYEFLERYSETDEVIISTVFDRRLRIGMHKSEVMPIAKIILLERAEGLTGLEKN